MSIEMWFSSCRLAGFRFPY